MPFMPLAASHTDLREASSKRRALKRTLSLWTAALAARSPQHAKARGRLQSRFSQASQNHPNTDN
jgi:hypothetical protein